MKILHIFGVVLAVHLGVFLVIFAVPGCRTTARKAPPTPADTMAPADTVAPAPEGFSDLAAPAPLPESVPPPVAAPAGSGSAAPSEATVRFSPLRPGAAAAAGAPVADGVAPARTHVVVRGDNLWTVARRYNLTVAAIAEANKLSPEATLQPGQKLLLPAPKRAATVTTAAETGAGDDARVHVVKGGDTLGTIARQHGTTIATLKRLNGLKSDLVRVGQRLTVPEPGAALPEPSVTRPAAPTAATVNANGALVHVVKPGESLDSIRKLYGVSVGALATANNIADPSRIRPGQELVIPGRKATPPAAPVPADASSPFLPVAAPANESPLTPAPEVPVIQVQETPKGGDAANQD